LAVEFRDEPARISNYDPLVANVTVLYVFTMVLHIFAVAFWISLMFVIIGVVAVSGPMTKELTQAPATVIAHFNLLGQSFMLTRQLVLLSAVLGGVAALTFATGTLQDSNSRATFARHALAAPPSAGFPAGRPLEVKGIRSSDRCPSFIPKGVAGTPIGVSETG
jgi:hypothetical protein